MAEEAVEKYLRSTNRPYSANDIVLNLHKQWGKTGVQRALDNLVGTQTVIEKCYGKQKVYVIRQDPNDCPTDEELKELDRQIEEDSKVLEELVAKYKALEFEMKALVGGKSKAQILKEIEILAEEIVVLELQKENVSSNKVPISPQRVAKLKKDNERVSKEFRKRKRLCMDIVNTVLESYPKPKKALMEDIGIETDEDADFTFENVQI